MTKTTETFLTKIVNATGISENTVRKVLAGMVDMSQADVNKAIVAAAGHEHTLQQAVDEGAKGLTTSEPPLGEVETDTKDSGTTKKKS